jgi:hypothetical protein
MQGFKKRLLQLAWQSQGNCPDSLDFREGGGRYFGELKASEK